MPKRDAMVGLATGQKLEREQEIYTPQIIVDICLEVWPEGIALDPCSGPGSIVPAKRKLVGTRIAMPTKANPDRCIWDGMGLVDQWADRTYINPPFNELEAWMAKLTEERIESCFEMMMLCPVRPQRDWWRECAALCDKTTLLNGLMFLGYTDVFPTPLALLYSGSRVATYIKACKRRRVGAVVTWPQPD